MPTLRSLSAEVQLLVQTSSHISSDLGTLLRTTQQVIAAHNDLKARIKTVSEGLEGVARVEEGVVSVDKGVFERERDGDMVFVKTPPTTPPTLVNSSVDPGQKIWKPNLRNGDETKNNPKREKGSARSSKQSSHASSPSHPTARIDPVNTNGDEKESPPSQHNTPYLPGAYVFSEVASPVQDAEPFLGLGSGRDEELDINAVLAQLAEKEREHAEAETETERRRSSRQNSKGSSKKSTPLYRRSPNIPMEKIPEHQQKQEQETESQKQPENHVWKGFNVSHSSPLWSTSQLIPSTYFLSDGAEVNGNGKIQENYAISLIPNADEFIEYVDSPRDSPPTLNGIISVTCCSDITLLANFSNLKGNVNNAKPSSLTPPTDVKPPSKASVSASTSNPDVKNGKMTSGAYSFTYTNNSNSNGNGNANGHVTNGNGKIGNGNGNVHDYATIRAKPTINPATSRSNPFSSVSNATSVATTTVNVPAPSATRSTQMPLRSKSPPVSNATNGNGNGHAYQQTNAAIGATIARPMSAMSNASASSSVMSPPYQVFHPPRQTDSDSDSDSDSQDSDREFFEKMLERASDTEAIKQPNPRLDKGKGKEMNVSVDKGKGKGKEKDVETVYQEKATEEPTTPRPGGESSKTRESTSTSNAKPPSVRSKTSPKLTGENITDTSTQNPTNAGEPRPVYPTIRTSPATSLASTQDNTPMPYSTQLHPHSVSTFSHDMMRSPQQSGQRTPEPNETPRIGNGGNVPATVSGAGGSGRSSVNGSSTGLSLAAVGEALQQQNQNQTNGHVHAHAPVVKNGPHSQLPPSAFLSSTSSRTSTVSAASFRTSSSSSSGGGSVPESSNASPDVSPSVRDSISVWASAVNGQIANTEEGQNLTNAGDQPLASTQSQSWKTFARATITRHPTNSSHSNGTTNGNDGDGIFLPSTSVSSAVKTASAASDAYPTITQERERGRGQGQGQHYTAVPVPPSPSPSVTRHSPLRRERERERESQRPTSRASSVRRSTMKMASGKTADSTKRPDGNETPTHTNGRGHSRALSDTSQANFSSFHFNHLSSLSSSQNNTSTSRVPASAILPSLPSAYKSTTSVRPEFVSPSVEESLIRLLQSQNIPFEDVGVIKRWKPPVSEEREKDGKNANGTVKRKSVHDSSPPSNPTSSSTSTSAHVQQPTVTVNGNGKPTPFEW
ncbi:hypothetical protein Clacol_004153 [Clathrus columnatus]|uniref:Uncharacterized protein n=1 Tax=Clathrus columnatus TaxID=1419009 RepID=A0AAV5A5M8_9AGAM|nr:hypothetical protein Clacol_004153 [Clathrus columnatus]